MSDPYFAAMLQEARRLVSAHGSLKRVDCVSKNPWRIDLLFADGHRLTVGDHSGRLDITLVKFGYGGTGPRCLCAFMCAAGILTSDDAVAKATPGTVFEAPVPAESSGQNPDRARLEHLGILELADPQFPLVPPSGRINEEN